MKKAKITKSKNKQDITSNDVIEMYSFQKIFKIFIILILIFIIFYVITNLLIKNKHTSEDNYTAVIDSTKIILNQLLNRKEEEYYVIATQPSKYKSVYIETDYINFYNNYCVVTQHLLTIPLLYLLANKLHIHIYCLLIYMLF